MDASPPSGVKRKRAAGSKFYAVRIGHRPGVYHTWDECLSQVTGYKGSIFKSFPSLTDAEKFVKGEELNTTIGTKQSYKFYAVRNGRVPGIYTDWPTAQKQITGCTKPIHKCFSTRAEAQRFLEGSDKIITPSEENNRWAGSIVGSANDQIEVDLKKPRKSTGSNSKAKDQVSIDDNVPGYEPGFGLPPGAEDGFDPNILLDPGTGNIIIKTKGQKAATKVQAIATAPGSMLRVYTDGSSLGNGTKNAFAGVGVYFGANDTRNVSEPFSGPKPTNQRAELTAIVRALDIVPRDRDLTIVTDSQYSIKCATEWYKSWQKNEWRASNGKQVENKDIIENIRTKIAERETTGARTSFEWIKGHKDSAGNVEADRLAVSGARAAQAAANRVAIGDAEQAANEEGTFAVYKT